MTEKTFIILILWGIMIIPLYMYWDCNRMMKKVRTELKEIGFEFDEKGNMK